MFRLKRVMATYLLMSFGQSEYTKKPRLKWMKITSRSRDGHPTFFSHAKSGASRFQDCSCDNAFQHASDTISQGDHLLLKSSLLRLNHTVTLKALFVEHKIFHEDAGRIENSSKCKKIQQAAGSPCYP